MSGALDNNCVEAAVFKQLLNSLRRAGFKVTHVGNLRVRHTAGALRALQETSDAMVYFRKAGDKAFSGWVRLIAGNGTDCISDYSCSGALYESVIEDVCKLVQFGAIVFVPCPGARKVWNSPPSKGTCVSCGREHA